MRQSSPPPPKAGIPVVAIIRIVLLLAAAGALMTAIGLTPVGDRARGIAAKGSALRYACPMHPEIESSQPGTCPICQMALEPISSEASGDGSFENLRRRDVVDFARDRALLFEERELRGPAWVDDGAISAIFYDDQIDVMTAEEMGSFTPSADPANRVPVKRLPDARAPWDGSTSRIRFGLDHAMKPGTAGWIELARKTRHVLTVPVSAVLEAPEGPYVLRVKSDFTVEKRPIRLGETFAGLGMAVVLSGLRAQDPVVTRATFFVDAERKQDIRNSDRGEKP